jgi:hypothetical protein
MKKILTVLAFALFISVASGTTVSQETAVIDLADNSVDVQIQVEELTSSSFTYVSSNNVGKVNASLDGRKLNCSTSRSAIGSEIRCDTDREENFTVKLDYVIKTI